MAGKAYRVLNEELTYPTPATLNKPRDEWVWKTTPRGAVVTDIPEVSVRWLLEQEHIEPAGKAAKEELADG